MGDSIEGSSGAAQGAQRDQSSDQSSEGGGILAKLFGRKPSEPTRQPTATDQAPRQQMHGMVNLSRMRVEDVAIPKADIIAVPEDIEKDELVSVFRDSGFTRVPVYRETLDQPIGMVHLKDFALRYVFNGDAAAFDVNTQLRPLLYVPPSMPIGVLLTKMQAERRHMALVIDEYGGVDGLLTIEDLIEQVVGEIEDEHDVDEGKFWAREKPGQYIALAKSPLDEFQAELGINLTDDDDIDAEEIDTLGGLVFMLAGHVPVRGEVIEHPCGAEFQVLDADPRRVKRMRVVLPSAS